MVKKHITTTTNRTCFLEKDLKFVKVGEELKLVSYGEVMGEGYQSLRDSGDTRWG